MAEHVGIGMSLQPAGVWNLDSAQNELAALTKTVRVVANSATRERSAREAGLSKMSLG